MSKKNYTVPDSWVSSKIFWQKFRNSFCVIHSLWSLVIKNQDFEDMLHPEQARDNQFKKIFLKFVRFWPRVYEPINWATGDIGVKGCDPEDFKNIDPHSQILVNQVVARSQSKQSKIMDLGCNCGRFLNALAEQGFDNLHGVDISQKALDYMPEWFPALKGKVDVECDLFQRYISKRDDREFDIVYTHGATVELVHPSYPMVRELCRITKSHIVFVINENKNRYPRFWEYEFKRNGFVPVEILRPVTQSIDIDNYEVAQNLSLLVFRRLK